MKSFVITRLQAGLIQSAFYMGYFLLAIPAALVMRRLGYKSGFVIGLLLFSAGAALFWPAAIVGRSSQQCGHHADASDEERDTCLAGHCSCPNQA